MHNILLVEDSLEFQHIISRALSEQYNMHLSSNLKDAQVIVEQNDIHLILLDINLPDQDGYIFLQQLKSHNLTQKIPVICITGRTHITDKVTAFSLGAEDYISKPFDPIELKVRVDSKLKRIQIDKDKNSMIIRGDLQINLKSHKVKIATKEKTTPVSLTPLEFKILCYLAKSPDQVFTRNQILTDVWGSDAEVFDRAVDVHVCSLRNKLLDLSYSIQAVPGVGYQFTEKNMSKLKKPAA